MSKMITRIAEAIYREFENRPRYAQLQMNSILAEELARAALNAMYEPTPSMINAGSEACQEHCDLTMEAAHKSWRAMIVDALGSRDQQEHRASDVTT